MEDEQPPGWAFEGRLLGLAGRGLLVVSAEDGRIRFASARARELLEAERPLAGRSFTEAVGADVDGAALARWLAPARSPRPLRWSSRAGPRRAEHVGSPDGLDRFVVVSEDERERDDELRFLRRAVDRLEALALAEHAAAAVAHELNNVLQSMLNLASLPAGEAPDEHGVALQRTAQHAAQLGRLLMETGRPRAQDDGACCDPCALLLRLEPMLECLLGARLRLALCTTEPAAVPPAALERVLLNLAANARDATAEGGTVVIRTDQIGDAVVVEVQDTGRGMDEATLRRARELAFTTKPGGTGLGLALVHRIVRRYGGTLRLDSAPGRGTRATVSLPRQPGSEA